MIGSLADALVLQKMQLRGLIELVRWQKRREFGVSSECWWKVKRVMCATSCKWLSMRKCGVKCEGCKEQDAAVEGDGNINEMRQRQVSPRQKKKRKKKAKMYICSIQLLRLCSVWARTSNVGTGIYIFFLNCFFFFFFFSCSTPSCVDMCRGARTYSVSRNLI